MAERMPHSPGRAAMSDRRLSTATRLIAEHAIAMQAIGLARLALDQHRDRYELLLESRRYMDSVGGLLDPTLYRDMLGSKSFAQQERMVKAALAFLKEIDAVAAEVGQ